MTTATDNTTHVRIYNDDVRLLLVDFLFGLIPNVACDLEDTPGTGDFVRDSAADERYWAASQKVRDLERLIVEVKDPATTTITLPFDRQKLVDDFREEAQWLINEHALIAGDPPIPADDRRFMELAHEALRLIGTLGGEGDA